MGYTPITWQVDRKCHMISASSLDKLCADMKTMKDDMSKDLHPHGARELVDDALRRTITSASIRRSAAAVEARRCFRFAVLLRAPVAYRQATHRILPATYRIQTS